MIDPTLALVTGGAIRLGEAISRALAQAGYTVVIHAKSHIDAAQKLAGELGGYALSADLTDRAAIDGLFTELDGLPGTLGVLINNAAIFERGDPLAVDQATWDRHLALNLTAPWLCSQHAARRMETGVIINLLDISATHPYLGYSHYSATKAGLLALTHGLAGEWAPKIRVNGVSPGAALMPEWYDEATREQRLARIPMAQEPGAVAVAETVLFLVDGPQAITGEIIAVDGGRRVVWS